MRHKAMHTMEKTAPRRERRTGGFPLHTRRNVATMPHPRPKVEENTMDAVYVVKYEKRSGSDIGHPIILAPSLAVSTAYRTKEKARFAMREIARTQAAYEVARAGHMPSPASLNAIPYYDENVDSLQVLTMEGMMHRYFIEKMPLV